MFVQNLRYYKGYYRTKYGVTRKHWPPTDPPPPPPTDRVHGLPYGPVHGLSLRTTPKNTELKIDNNWKFVYTGCMDRPLLPVKSQPLRSGVAFSFAVDRSASKLSSSSICLFCVCVCVWNKDTFQKRKKFFRHFDQDREIVKPGASSQTRGRMIRTKWRRERKKIQIELTYYQSFSKDSGPQRRKGQYVINRLCTRAWVLVCWICGALRLRFRRHEWHVWSIQTTGKFYLFSFLCCFRVVRIGGP